MASKVNFRKPIIACFSYDTTRMIRQANIAYKEGRFQDAINHYKECVGKLNNKEQKAKYNLYIAKIYHRKFKDITQSRKFAYAAIELKPN